MTDERLTYEREIRIRILLTNRDYRDGLQLAADGQRNARILLAEVDRLRAERDALAAKVAAAEGHETGGQG